MCDQKFLINEKIKCKWLIIGSNLYWAGGLMLLFFVCLFVCFLFFCFFFLGGGVVL